MMHSAQNSEGDHAAVIAAVPPTLQLQGIFLQPHSGNHVLNLRGLVAKIFNVVFDSSGNSICLTIA